MKHFAVGLTACFLLLLGGASARTSSASAGESTQIVVTFSAPPLAGVRSGRERAAREIDNQQRRFARALRDAVPSASIRWRYRLVANGVSVVLPGRYVPLLAQLGGAAEVFPAQTYRAQAGPVAGVIRARSLPGLALESAGEGIKIGIIDDGIQKDHPFFDPTGYTMPAGYPKGQKPYTSAKVIVARAFAPPGTSWKNAGKPYDPGNSGHATHVAGIAAGNPGTIADGQVISGIAPRAYLGNYKALTVPTDAGVGLDGNAPELVAAIEAAVADGMDVINLSLGEPEIEASRDVVALALDAASDAGVVAVVAAGNDFDDFGSGSLASPGSSAKAITVGAVNASATQVAGFSSSGPTPLSLRLKPDVVAPGVGILSAVPGDWSTMSGTSMAAPHVAGAVALLRQRHPDWTPERIKAALSASARPVVEVGKELVPVRAGSGLIDVAAADRPLVVARPTNVSLGLLRPGRSATVDIELEDAGDGAGEWVVAVSSLGSTTGATVGAAGTVTVPGILTLDAVVPAAATDGDLTGIVTLTRGTVVRRVPFWGRVTAPALGDAPFSRIHTPGMYKGDTRGKPMHVDVYRYPQVPANGPVSSKLAGPEQVFRFTLERPATNFGVVVTRRGAGARVEPRVVSAGDENRLTGYAGLPLNLNPYLTGFGDPTPVAGAVRAAAGTYDIVFDSPTAAGAGAFSFRFWVNDVTPPTVALLTRSARRGAPLRVRVGDAGSGIDPASVDVRLGSTSVEATLRGIELLVPTGAASPGLRRLRVQISDYQETRNMENVTKILPNTRVLTTTVKITPR